MKKFICIIFLISSFQVIAQSNLDKVYLTDRSMKEGTIRSLDEVQITFEEKGSFGTVTIIRLSTIWKIIYSNGFEEVFNEPLPENLLISTESSSDAKGRSALGLGASKSSKQEEIKTKTPSESGFLATLSENQSWRPLLSVDIAAALPIVFSPDEWTATSEGLAFRFGVGGELGISINPIKNVGISISQGFSNHFSWLPEFFRGDSSETKVRERINMINTPTTFKINLYPKNDILITGGMVLNGLSISNSNPKINNHRMNGYTFGLGKIFPVGLDKNYFELSVNYTGLNSNAFIFSLDADKFPELESLDLNFTSLNIIDIKLKYCFGIFK